MTSDTSPANFLGRICPGAWPATKPTRSSGWTALHTSDCSPAGKRKKVALVAAMRKLLTMPNAIARHGSQWDPTLHPA